MLSLFRPKPSLSSVKVVANLDALVSTPIGVQVNGRIVVIKPMTVEQMAIVTMRFAEILEAKSRNDVSPIESKEAERLYRKLFADAVDGLSAKEMEKMTIPQTLALYQLIIDCYGGRAQVETEKKKRKLSTEDPLKIMNECMFGWISQLCHVYGWTVRYCLDLPVSHFFGMLRETNVLMGVHYSHMSDIAMLANTNVDHYRDLKQRYKRMMGAEEVQPESPAPLPMMSRPVYEAGSVEAKYAVMQLFKSLRLH